MGMAATPVFFVKNKPKRISSSTVPTRFSRVCLAATLQVEIASFPPKLKKQRRLLQRVPFVLDFGFGLPHGEVNLVQVNGVRLHVPVAILLVIDGDSVPACFTGRTVDIERVGDAIQSDGLEEQVATRSPLDLNDKVIPSVVLGVARHSGRHPFLVDIVVSVPFMATGDAALMSPDKAFGGDELVYVELQGLRSRDVFRVKVHVVNEIVKVRDQFTLEPVGEQLVQMPQLGASRAYPDQPFCF